ncbi:hypothetical protein [Streptomyces sp. NPDC088752]|uniref:hypothetical protein n=1 Tax=Streptomyces sp. NPDC088752 TaxID=3154963 RepID=UPI003413C134
MPPVKRRPAAKPAAQPEMRTPVWPERTCRDSVSGEYAIHSCEVVESHRGPHASRSVPESVKLRLAWEARNPELREPDGADPFVTS